MGAPLASTVPVSFAQVVNCETGSPASMPLMMPITRAPMPLSDDRVSS